MAEPDYSDPSRYTWPYIDNLRARATEWGTVNNPNVQRLLARLEQKARELHGERRTPRAKRQRGSKR